MYYKHETCLINVVSHFPSIFSASKQKKKTKEGSILITREITKELIPIVSTKMENRNGNGDARAYFLQREGEKRENKCNDYNFTKPGA